MEFVFGHLLEVGPSGGLNEFKFQNYALGENVAGFDFLPFGFGGAIATLQGDNLDATLQFANTQITRNFVITAIEESHVAKVSTILWNPTTFAVEQTLYEYFGVCAAGGLNETTIQVKLNSVLDAVQANVPGRRLNRNQVGNIPFTSQVSV